jgi:hypothetical protein
MNQTKNEKQKLSEAIEQLKLEKAQKLLVLREQLSISYESLKPVNFIKNTVEDAISSPDLKKSLLNNAIGLATGYLSKKVMMGGSHNPIKNIVGTMLQFLVTNVVAKNSDEIIESGEKVLNFFAKKKPKSNHYPNYH